MKQKLTLIIILSLISSMQFFAEPFTEYVVLQKQFDSRNKGPYGKMSLLREKRTYQKYLDTLKPTNKYIYEYDSLGRMTKQTMYIYKWETSEQLLNGYYKYIYGNDDSLLFVEWSYLDSNNFKSYVFQDYVYYHTLDDTTKVINNHDRDGSIYSTDSIIYKDGKLLTSVSKYFNDNSYENKLTYFYNLDKNIIFANTSGRFYHFGEWSDWYIDDRYACYLDDEGKYIYRTVNDVDQNDKKHYFYDKNGLLSLTIDTNISMTPDQKYYDYIVTKFTYKFDSYNRITEQTVDRKTSDFESGAGIYIEKYIYSDITDVNTKDVQKCKIIDLNLSENSNSIKYKLFESGTIAITLYNFLGQELGIIDSGYREAGEYEINIDNPSIVSGMYFFVLKLNNNYYYNKIIKVQ